MKKLLFFIVSVLSFQLSVAQEVITLDEADMKKKQINDIKKGEEAIYADVIDFVADDVPGTVTVAQQRSMALLQTHVIEIFAKRMKMDKKDVQEIWNVIDDKCQNIVVKKGDLFRVFSYVMKDALHFTRKKPKKKDVEKYLMDDKKEPAKELVAETQTQETEAALLEDDPELAAMQAAEDAKKAEELAKADELTKDEQAKAAAEAARYEELAQAEEARKAAEAKQAEQAQLEAAAQAEAIAKAEAVARAEAKAKAEAVARAEAVAKAEAAKRAEEVAIAERARIAAAKQQELLAQSEARKTPGPQKVAAISQPVSTDTPAIVNSVMQQEDLTSLLRFLIKEKKSQRLVYGNMASMKDINHCYVIILDKTTKSLVTVLGHGNPDKINYITHQYDRVANYQGGNYMAIFIQEL